jgi:succinate dehydrogenase / fumarate reductase cytochrome b subunit
MKLATNIFGSSLGKKYVMAGSGAVLFLFVVGHLAGNLQFFLGREAINRYGYFLQSNVELLWPVRLFLLLMLFLHVWSAVRLSIENKAARPVAYAQYRPVASNYASRTMLMSGIIIFVFVVYHLLHYTVQVRYLNLTGRDFAAFEDDQHRHDIFKMLVVGFHNPAVSGFYILGMALLCLHLSHGLSAMFQSLGLKNRSYGPCLERLAAWVAGLIFLGYSSIPVAILLGYGKEALG